jgi:hypothetical protein
MKPALSQESKRRVVMECIEKERSIKWVIFLAILLLMTIHAGASGADRRLYCQHDQGGYPAYSEPSFPEVKAPIRLGDERAWYSRIVVMKEDLSTFPCETTIKNIGGGGWKVRIRMQYWDIAQKHISDEDLEVNCSNEAWFRWHPPSGMRYYRYIFY